MFDGTQQHFCTMAIMGRKAYESIGYIYHPSYISLWCDQEYTQYWKARGRLKKYSDIIFEHVHPASLNNGTKYPKMVWDDLYRRNEERSGDYNNPGIWEKDEMNYRSRRKKGFPK